MQKNSALSQSYFAPEDAFRDRLNSCLENLSTKISKLKNDCSHINIHSVNQAVSSFKLNFGRALANPDNIPVLEAYLDMFTRLSQQAVEACSNADLSGEVGRQTQRNIKGLKKSIQSAGIYDAAGEKITSAPDRI